MQLQITVKRRRRKDRDAPIEQAPTDPAANTYDAAELLARIDELLGRE